MNKSSSILVFEIALVKNKYQSRLINMQQMSYFFSPFHSYDNNNSIENKDTV